MALPPRAAAIFVLLSEPDTNPVTQRETGTKLTSLIDLSYDPPKPPRQRSFFASQTWYQSYPSDVVAKVHLGVLNPYGGSLPSGGAFESRFWMQGYANNQHIDSTYPDNIVYEYDPTPPPGPDQPAPDPNGNTGTKNIDTTTDQINVPGFFYLPRWNTDTPYDITDSGIGEGTIWPKFDTEYYITPNGFSPYIGGPVQFGPWSADLTVDNNQSKVLNLQTGDYEYYDFSQATFDFKQIAKVKIFTDTNVCCWNKGTVITGKVTFQSIDVTTSPVGVPFGSDYGFSGMMAKTGSTVSEAGEQSFSITISEDYDPVIIDIPSETGKITFINDYSIESVTPPA